MSAPHSLVTRRADVADHEPIMRIWREASRLGHPFLGEAVLDGQEAVTREQHLPRADLMVAERNGEIVGFIATVGAHVGALFVAPAAQGAGVGRRLLEESQSRHEALTLEVYEANASACAFYQRTGFVRIGRSDHDQEGRPFPVLRMAWTAAHPVSA